MTPLIRIGVGRKYRMALLFTSWLSLSVLGLGLLHRYANTAGPSSLERSDVRSLEIGDVTRLLVFLHPHCPCSRATLSELQLILDREGSPPLTELWMAWPEGVAPEWIDSSLVVDAASIPNVKIRWDRGGQVASRYDAQTSGEVVLLDPAGRVRFRGGITVSRGHRGPNRGAEVVKSILRGDELPFSQAPVFGCPLGNSLSTEIPGD